MSQLSGGCATVSSRVLHVSVDDTLYAVIWFKSLSNNFRDC